MKTENSRNQAPRSPDPRTAANRLRRLSTLRPRLAIVLGSGFRHAVSGLDVERSVPCGRVSGFPVPAVSGHGHELHFGTLGGVPALVLDGRAHYYEGHALEHITFPIRVFAELGVRDLLLTNAAGGINPKFRRGEFMLLEDHVNFMGANPLRGRPVEKRKQFVDLTTVYDPGLGLLLRRAAQRVKVKLHEGVYLAVSGPSYETPAEIRAFATLGADVVGMSTVPEAIVAKQCGMNVAAISLITNPAARRGNSAISHAEVLEAAAEAGRVAAELLNQFAKLYGDIS